jgi:tetratricopeptide (TPR) repeat protein
MWSGRLAGTEEACRSLLDRAHDPSVEAPARLLLARTLAAQGRVRDSLQELERVRRSRELGDELAAGAWGAEGMARLELGAISTARWPRPGRHGRLPPGPGPPGHQPRHGLAGHGRGARGQPGSGARAGRGGGPARRPPGGSILVELDRLQDARHALEAGIRTSEVLGVRWPLPFYATFLGMERYLAGEWDDAVAEFEAALELVGETGERYRLVLGHSVRSLIALRRGDLHLAEEAAAGAARELDAHGPRYRSHWANWARALLLEAGGATREAFATLRVRDLDDAADPGRSQSLARRAGPERALAPVPRPRGRHGGQAPLTDPHPPTRVAP